MALYLSAELTKTQITRSQERNTVRTHIK